MIGTCCYWWIVVETFLLFACVFVAVKFFVVRGNKKVGVGKTFVGCMYRDQGQKGETSRNLHLLCKLFTVCCSMLFVALLELSKLSPGMNYHGQ